MKLKKLIHDFLYTDLETEINGISSDTRTLEKGNLFLAYPGEESDGRKYIEQAIKKGASAILMEEENSGNINSSIPVFKIKHLKNKAGEISAAFYNYPTSEIQIIGITGTNGKTSTSFYIAEILNEIGVKTAVIGTTGYGIPGELTEIANTTPGPIELQKIFYELKEKNVKAAAMEVSSHALAQGRVFNIEIDAAVYTNLTQDHLDYHKDMEEYANAKKMIFFLPSVKYISLNIDDKFGAKWFHEFSKTKKTLIGYSRSINYLEDNFLFAENIKIDMQGLSFELIYQGIKKQIKTNLLGHFNVSNILGAVSVLISLGYDFEKIVKASSKLKAVPGRMQVIRDAKNNFPTAVVDYAHTPDALVNALSALKKQCTGKLICVFGCGGNRDKTKRPRMAEAVEKFSDIIIVTNDNPRFENELEIIEDIKNGFKRTENISIETDRKKAIEKAMKIGCAGDIVLIAGKGHEDYQIVNGVKHHFSDAETVKNFLKSKAF